MIDPDDEHTALSRRNDPGRRQGEAPDGHDEVDELDERTRPSRRSSAEVDAVDDTVISARSAVPSDSEIPTQAATESAPAGPRRTAHPPAPEPHDAPAGVKRAPSGARLAPEPSVETSATQGRVAAPPASDTPGYRARSVPPITAVRTEPARRMPQDHIDTAAADATRRRHRRRRKVVVVAAASILVIVAALALAVLLTTG